MKKIQMLCSLVCLLLVTSAAMARDLKIGMTGTDVKQWQNFLKTRNFDLPADGQFGPVTKRATVIFQKKWKLYPDGVVGPQTLRKARQLGFGSSSVAPRAKESGGELGKPVSAEMQRVIKYRVAAYLMKTLTNPRSLKVIGETKVIRITKSGYPYAVRVKYGSKNTKGDYIFKDKIFVCDEGGDVVLVKDADELGM